MDRSNALPDLEAEKAQLLRDIDRGSLQPLWIDTAGYVPRRPAPRIVATQWREDAYLPLLHRAGDLVRGGEADRRVLVLRNPGLPPFGGTSATLYACIQLLLPGEHAPPHRHTQSAFRLVLSGDGAYTTVDGATIAMSPGDFILTPAWSWHRHGHDGKEPMIWLDGLDNAIVNLFDASFFEPQAGDVAPASRDAGETLRFPYAEIRAALETSRDAGEIDPVHGATYRYADPRSGADALPTIAATMHLLPGGFSSVPYRSTDAAIFVALEGSGRTIIGDREFSWSHGDVFVVPGWTDRQHVVERDAVLFSFSDRAAQQKLGLWREQRHPFPA